MSTPVGTYFIPESQWPWEPRVAVPVSTGHRSDSAALLPDGRVLYVFVEGSEVKQGYAPDLESFLTVDGSVDGITAVLSGSQPNSCVFHGPSGDLFLATSTTPQNVTPVDVRETLLWRSPSGVGGDWVLHSEVFRAGIGQSSNVGGSTASKAVGVPLFLSPSRWVLAAPRYYTGRPDYTAHHNAIFLTTDGGASWSQVASMPHGVLGGAYGSGLSRNIGQFAGRLYVQSSSSYATSPSRVWVSDDDGSSWAAADTLGMTTWPSTDGDHLYRIRGSSGLLERSASPGDGGGAWEQVRPSFPGMEPGTGNGNGAIVQPLGPEFVYMHYGRVMAIRNVRRPVVGFIGWR